MSEKKLIALAVTLIAAGLTVTLVALLWPAGSAPPDDTVASEASGERSGDRQGAHQSREQTGSVPLAEQVNLLRPALRVWHWSRNVHSQEQPSRWDCKPAVTGPPLVGQQIVSYYGNPYRDDMGILGELEPQELVRQLKAHAELYDSLNGPLGVQPALHLVYATAQGEPGADGLYLLRLDDETLRDYIELACENDLLIFLDIQVGHSDVESEVELILPYLEQPHVHAAIDPEWAMAEGEVPGETFGSIDAADINGAQAMIEDLIEEKGLSDKVLVVHRFIDEMLTNDEFIEDYARVKLVIDMDGFGPADIKRVKYGWYAEPAEYSGIKLFFRDDTPLLSEAEVLELRPDVIIYQ